MIPPPYLLRFSSFRHPRQTASPSGACAVRGTTHVCDFPRLDPLLDGRAVDDGEAVHAGARVGELLDRRRPKVQVGEDKIRAAVHDPRPHGL